MTVTDSTISGNSAFRGGGIVSAAGDCDGDEQHDQRQLSRCRRRRHLQWLSNVMVTDSTISGNSAGIRGGGIPARSANVTVTNSTISGNSADWRRRHLQWSRRPDGDHSTISGNSARVNGGGIYSGIFGDATIVDT